MLLFLILVVVMSFWMVHLGMKLLQFLGMCMVHFVKGGGFVGFCN